MFSQHQQIEFDMGHIVRFDTSMFRQTPPHRAKSPGRVHPRAQLGDSLDRLRESAAPHLTSAA
jgi:hypothetical protein